MKGIILAGGSGSRLYPITKVTSKQLLPIYDKPMIYYPLSVLMLAGIKKILIITTPDDQDRYKNLLGDGNQFGISLNYAVQPKPRGLAQAFIIGENFIGNDKVCLILGDNIFFGERLSKLLKQTRLKSKNATIFAYEAKNISRFGVVEIDKKNKALSIEEKPKKPKSRFAVSGLYIYDNDVIEIAKKIKPSKRGELEITSINKTYIKRGNLNVKILGRGFTWLDAGTYDSLLETSYFVKTIEKRQGNKIACLEEIAFNNGWISKQKLNKITRSLSNNPYKKYLLSILKK